MIKPGKTCDGVQTGALKEFLDGGGGSIVVSEVQNQNENCHT